MTLYLRGESDRMMQTLSDADRNNHHIWFSGCPGIGKSTMLFGYLNLPDVSSNGFLWIHFSSIDVNVIYRKKSGESLKGVFQLDNDADKFLSQFVKSCTDVSYIAIDGAPASGKGITSKLFSIAGSRRDVKAVACTSLAPESYNTEQLKKTNWPKYIYIDSWSLAEYKDAYNTSLPSFMQKFSSESDLEESYFYAGGSIRLMCAEKQQTLDVLNFKLKEVVNYSSVFGGLRGEGSVGSVNTLMQMFDSRTIPLSKYVVNFFASRVEESFIIQAEQMYVKNPAWLGWVFEMKVFQKVRTKSENAFEFLYADKNEIRFFPWSLKKDEQPFLREYDPLIDFNDIIQPNTIVFPTKFNQALWDMAYLRKPNSVDIYQMTRRLSRDYNFTALIPMLKHLFEEDGNNEINFYVVIPYENKNKFRIIPSEVIGAHDISTYDKRWATVELKTEVLPDAELLAPTNDSAGKGEIKSKKKKKERHISHVHGRSVGAEGKIEVLLFRLGTAE